MLLRWVLILGTVLLPQLSRADSLVTPGSLEIKNLSKLAEQLKIGKYKDKKFSEKIKIAVLDNGFYGYESEVGRGLPAGTICYSNSEIPGEQCKDEFKREPNSEDAKQKPFHGLLMAEIVSQILAKAGDSNYEIALFRTSGFDRFTRAVDAVIAQRFDVVLYSDVWEFGGNSDGKGFVNAVVDKAVNAGVIWINAAGNYGRATRAAPVAASGDWVTFKTKKETSDEVKVRCTLTRPCNLRLVLTWNDFKDDADAGTDKSLALFLYDDKKNQIASSEKIQMISPPADDPKYSKLPRQMIVTKIDPGTAKKPKLYTVKVKMVSKNFDSSSDKLRLIASGIGIEMLNPTPGETIFPPADNPGVIVIGASDAIQTSESVHDGIPKIYLKSMVELKNGLKPFQSSTAAALATAVTGLFLGSGGTKSKAAVEDRLVGLSRKPEYETAAHANEKSDRPKAAEEKEKPSVAEEKRHGRSRRHVARSERRSSRFMRRAQYAERGSVREPLGPAPSPRPSPPYPQRSPPPYSQPPRPASAQCLFRVSLPYVYPAVLNVLRAGGATPVAFQGRTAIAVTYNFAAATGLSRGPGQVFFITPAGPLVACPQACGLGPDAYEVIPQGLPICN